MGGILVYALHDGEGNFNNNSLGAISEAAKLAGELGSEAGVVVVGNVSARPAHQEEVHVLVKPHALAALAGVKPVLNLLQRLYQFCLQAGLFAHLAERSLFDLLIGVNSAFG